MPLPFPVRIAAGLVATAVEQARDLPRHVIEFPVTAVSQALQASMRVQQRVTELAIKGDRALGVLRPVEEKPSWATFDEDEPPRRNGAGSVTKLRTPARPTSAGPGLVDALNPENDPDMAVDELIVAEALEDELLDEELTIDEALADEALLEDALADEELVEDILAEEALVDDTPAAEPPVVESPVDSSDDGIVLDETEELTAPIGELAEVDGPAAELLAESADDESDVTETFVAETSVTDSPRDADRDTDADAAGDLPPALPDYDNMSIPQLRGKLRFLSLPDLQALLEWETTHGERPPFLTMLGNRITTVLEG